MIDPIHFAPDTLAQIVQFLPYNALVMLRKSCKWMHTNIKPAQMTLALKRGEECVGKVQVIGQRLRLVDKYGTIFDFGRMHARSNLVLLKTENRTFSASGIFNVRNGAAADVLSTLVQMFRTGTAGKTTVWFSVRSTERSAANRMHLTLMVDTAIFWSDGMERTTSCDLEFHEIFALPRWKRDGYFLPDKISRDCGAFVTVDPLMM